MEYIDLHAHSNVSDGSLTPTELVRLACAVGLRAVALTDHDNIGGLPEAVAAAVECGLELIPGVEISAEFTKGTMHILGYYVWEGRDNLSAALETLQKARSERNPKMICKLNELGFDLAIEDVMKYASGGQIGRPHMAVALVEKGYVSTVDQAFDRFLAKGKPAYVEKFRFSPFEAITMIRDAGGVPGLAHPFTLELDSSSLRSLVKELKDQGLEAIEVYSPEHTIGNIHLYQELALKYDLVITGGTDFHGANKPGINLGTGRGNFRVSYALLSDLKKRKNMIRKGRT